MSTPTLGAPITITSTVELTVTYTDATTDTVQIGTGTYYMQGDGTSTDLVQKLQDAFTADAEGSWTCTLHEDKRGHLKLSKVAGTKGVTSVTFAAPLSASALGFSVATEVISAATLGASPYRVAWLWCPDAVDDSAEPTGNQQVTRGAFTGTGVGSMSFYTTPDRWNHNLIEVYAAEMFNHYRADSTHAGNVADLNVNDPNATLEAFLVQVRSDSDGIIPTLRWTTDYTTPATYRQVRMLNFALYGGPRAWVKAKNPAPLWFELEWEFAEVPA